MQQELTTMTVTVRQVSQHGFKIDGDKWLNWSRYGTKSDVAIGDKLIVEIDDRGFVRKVLTKSDAGQTPPAARSVETHAAVVGRAATPPPAAKPLPMPPVGSVSLYPDAETRIRTRRETLATAAVILSSGGRPTDGESVAALAAVLEGWILRE